MRSFRLSYRLTLAFLASLWLTAYIGQVAPNTGYMVVAIIQDILLVTLMAVAFANRR